MNLTTRYIDGEIGAIEYPVEGDIDVAILKALK